MKLVKYSIVAAAMVSLTSCLKAKTDLGGMRTDQGSILTSISESQYLNTNDQNVGLAYTHNTFANFSFTTPNEAVKLFTLKITQARDVKMSGDMKVKLRVKPLTGYDQIPTGAFQFGDTTFTVPASSATVFEVPVTYQVNKSLLNPNNMYGMSVELVSSTQGAVNVTDGHIDVIINGLLGSSGPINNTRINGRYQATTTIEDSAKILGITNNTRPYILSEGKYDPYYSGNEFLANHLYATDVQIYAGAGSTTGFSLYAFNLTTGASTAVVQVVYKIDPATGKVIDVLNRSNLVSLNPTFDNSVSNSYVYTNNYTRSLNVKYTVRLTVGGLTRPFTITDRYTYDIYQIYANE